MKRNAAKASKGSLDDQVNVAITKLRKLSSKSTRDGMARYGLPSANALGVPVGKIQNLGKELGRDHELAEALWQTGIYEARMLAAFVDEPELVTPTQMDRWCKDFDNWGIVDTVCFKLFDQTPHAWKKVVQWSRRSAEFEKRAAFALLACLGVHDKEATNEQFLQCLPLIKKAATDERNFVKKGVSWALRVVGRRNVELNQACVELAEELAASDNAASRSLGKEALREFRGRIVTRKLSKEKSKNKR
jgi:3-methyladenine DNA glycosylase AlkD